MLPKCARCGEILTAPYMFNGQTYGYSCIKIVNPTWKNNPKALWVAADSVEIKEELSNGNIKMRAIIGERKFAFWAKKIDGVITSYETIAVLTGINVTLVNVMAYKIAAWKVTYIKNSLECNDTAYGFTPEKAKDNFLNVYKQTKTEYPKILSITYTK